MFSTWRILSNQVQGKIFDGLLLSAMWVNIVIQLILFLINILGYDKHMKGYDKYINDCYKYIKDYLEKIFTAMTNILTPI